MKSYTNNESISKFYNSIMDEFPDVSRQDVREILRCYFDFIKEHIESGKFPTIRMTYLGAFIVYPKKVRYVLEKLERDYGKGLISESTYLRKRGEYVDFLDRVPIDDKKRGG